MHDDVQSRRMHVYNVIWAHVGRGGGWAAAAAAEDIDERRRPPDVQLGRCQGHMPRWCLAVRRITELSSGSFLLGRCETVTSLLEHATAVRREL